MPEPWHQNHDQHDVEHHAGNANADRCFGVFARKEARCQHLDQNRGRQAKGKNGQRHAGHKGFLGSKGAAFKQDIDHRQAHDPKGNRRRQGQKEGDFNAAILAIHRGFGIIALQLARQRRQKGGANGNANHAKRQLLNAISVIQPRNCAIRYKGRQHGVDQKIDLINASPDHARDHAFAQKLDPVINAWQLPFDGKARTLAGNHHGNELCHARNRDPPSKGMGRRFGDRCQTKQGTNQADIENDRRGCGRGIAMKRIHHARHQRNGGNKRKIREGDARQFDGERKFFRVFGKTRRKHIHRPGHQDFDDCDQKAGDQNQHRHGARSKFAGDIQTAFFNVASQKRDEGCGKRALAKQAAKQVGELERHKERIGHAPGTEHPGDQNVAAKSQQTGQQGKTTDGGNRADKRHALAFRIRASVKRPTRCLAIAANFAGGPARVRKSDSRK